MEFKDIAACFNKPITVAAKELGTCTTNLKKFCRSYGISRWPYRKIHSLETQANRLDDENPFAAAELRKELALRKERLMNSKPSTKKYSKKKSAKKRKPDDSFSDDSFDGLSDSSSSYSKKHKKGLEEVVKKDVVPATVSAVIPAERRPSMNNTFIEIPPLPVVPLLEPIPVSRFTPSPYFSFALAPMYPEEGAQPHKPIVTPVVPQAELDPLFPYGDDFLFYDWLPVSAHN